MDVLITTSIFFTMIMTLLIYSYYFLKYSYNTKTDCMIEVTEVTELFSTIGCVLVHERGRG